MMKFAFDPTYRGMQQLNNHRRSIRIAPNCIPPAGLRKNDNGLRKMTGNPAHARPVPALCMGRATYGVGTIQIDPSE
jgi:hypothetical protein